MTRDEKYDIYKIRILSINSVNLYGKTICHSLLNIAVLYKYKYMSNYNIIV